ncbi:MAG: winged helix-turn-helix transcriptional regulator [Alphaproteobacteria bacterium]|nr:winged helix-turn-helix transcriptional regulator [Alphaproteobacteria bacterium]
MNTHTERGAAAHRLARNERRSDVALPDCDGSQDEPRYRVEQQIGYLLRRAHQRASAIFQEQIGDSHITPTQFSSLVKLYEDGELSQNHLGRLVGMDKATTQGVIRRLKSRDLVSARADPGDARRTLLRLTTEGDRLVQQLMRAGPRVTSETLRPLSPDEQRQLVNLLARIA